MDKEDVNRERAASQEAPEKTNVKCRRVVSQEAPEKKNVKCRRVASQELPYPKHEYDVRSCIVCYIIHANMKFCP